MHTPNELDSLNGGQNAWKRENRKRGQCDSIEILMRKMCMFVYKTYCLTRYQVKLYRRKAANKMFESFCCLVLFIFNSFSYSFFFTFVYVFSQWTEFITCVNICGTIYSQWFQFKLNCNFKQYSKWAFHMLKNIDICHVCDSFSFACGGNDRMVHCLLLFLFKCNQYMCSVYDICKNSIQENVNHASLNSYS